MDIFVPLFMSVLVPLFTKEAIILPSFSVYLRETVFPTLAAPPVVTLDTSKVFSLPLPLTTMVLLSVLTAVT